MFISFIVPMYNVEDYIISALESINSQDYTNWECIIVDDGSTDKSSELSSVYIKDKNKFKIITQKNQGSGIARNTGLNAASGDYICFVDPDDYISSDALKNNVPILKRYDPDVLVNGYFENKRFKVIKNLPLFEGYYNKNEFIAKYNLYRVVGESSLWNKLYKKSFLDENNILFTDQRVGEDTLFNYEVYKYLDDIFIDKNAYYYYNTGREGSAVNSFKENKINYEKNIARAFYSLIKYWEKEEEFKLNIHLLNWRIIFNELLNVNMSDSPLSANQKNNRIFKLLTEPKYSNTIHSLEYEDVGSRIGKISLYLLKKEKISFLCNIIQIYLKVYR